MKKSVGGGIEKRVVVLITGGARAEKHQFLRTSISDGMPEARWNGNRIARPDQPGLIAQGHCCNPGEDVVDLLSNGMVVRRCGLSHGKPRLGQRLVSNARVAMGQQLPNR